MEFLYGCGKSGNQLNDVLTHMDKRIEDKKNPPSGSNPNAQKKNLLYAL